MGGELLRTALVYDFDGTLAPGNVQEHSLLPNALGQQPAEFWARVKEIKRQQDADEILVYLQQLLVSAEQRGVKITRDLLREHGAATALFAGLPAWFERIDAHARERGLLLEHYVVSSGIEEMIAGTSIAAALTRIYGSKYMYDVDGVAVWPAAAVNYTTKTQYLFRINKGVPNYWDNERINHWIPHEDRPVPFSRMVYVGDGDTDIPSMKMVRHQGGYSVGVFDPKRWATQAAQPVAFRLIAEDRANFVVPADYTEGSQLDVTIKGLLGRIARDQAGYRGDGADDAGS